MTSSFRKSAVQMHQKAVQMHHLPSHPIIAKLRDRGELLPTPRVG